MPSFLSPAFLAGLLTLAIPILVHLRMRERRTSQPFPSLMFVRRIPHKSFRRRTLQNLLLFAARALALILLSVAFARPYFPVEAGAGAALAGPVGRVVALDVSASMGYEGVFARARVEAERAIDETRPGDPVGLLLFSDEAQGMAPPSTDHGRALAALHDAAPGPRATRLAPALRLAGEWLTTLKVDRREVVLITDGQSRALTGASEVPLPSGTTILVRSVAAVNPDNAAVADVTVEHVREQDRVFAVATARLIHQGPAEKTVTASLEVAGRTIEAREIALPRSGAVNVTFAKAPLPAGVSKARVVLKTDGLEADNAFHFILGAGNDIAVLLLDPSPYVSRALEIGEQPSFDIVSRSSLDPRDLKDRSLVVLGDLPGRALSSSASAALARFVSEGGGLLATAPLTSLRGEASRLLPRAWGENVSRIEDRGASLGYVDLDHPALFAFKQARGSDFSRARFLQYRLLKEEAGRPDRPLKVLARFDDGHEALVEAAYGLGRVVAFTSPLDGLMSDLPIQPLFLPLIHELARYAAAHKDAPLYHRIGASVDLREREGPTRAADPLVSLILPSGKKLPMAADASGLELTEAGFFEAIRASGAQHLVASNLEASESDLSALEADELEAAIRPATRPSNDVVPLRPAEGPERESWWRAALLSVALLMALETVMANSRRPKATS